MGFSTQSPLDRLTGGINGNLNVPPAFTEFNLANASLFEDEIPPAGLLPPPQIPTARELGIPVSGNEIAPSPPAVAPSARLPPPSPINVNHPSPLPLNTSSNYNSNFDTNLDHSHSNNSDNRESASPPGLPGQYLVTIHPNGDRQWVQKPRRRQVKNACQHCRKSNKKCDEEKPCQRCIDYGMESECRVIPPPPRNYASRGKRTRRAPRRPRQLANSG